MIKWIPSHLDDTAKEHIKQKHLLAGDIDTIDLLGKVAADKLANAGFEMHDDVTPLLQLSQDRVYVTTLVQKMLLHILTNYVDSSSADVKHAE